MLRRPVTMLVVHHGDDLYVRSVNGRGSSWFRGAETTHHAHIQAGGIEQDVSLVETDEREEGNDHADQDRRRPRRHVLRHAQVFAHPH